MSLSDSLGNICIALSILQNPTPNAKGCRYVATSLAERDSECPIPDPPPSHSRIPTPSMASAHPTMALLLNVFPLKRKSSKGTTITAMLHMNADLEADTPSSPAA